jgi:hydrophobe/amphiphile efflux-1 (HAE1) family protein
MKPKNTHRHGGLPSFSIRRPVGTIMLSSVVVVLGGYFLSGLSLDLLPSIVYPTVRANVNNRGVAPEVLEETIAKPLENTLATTENLVSLETEIQEGRVGVNLQFRYGTNVDFALQDASKNLDRVRSQLPVEADPPTIFKFDPSQAPIYETVFSSNALDLVQLRDWVENRLRPQLLTIEGVASIDISGGLVREIQVILDQERLRSYGLTVSQVIEAIRSTNQDIAAGRVSSPEREVVGKTEGKFRNVAEIRGMLLNVPGGARIPLVEIADVRDTHREQRLWARLDGVPAVRVNVRKQPDANTVRVANEVNARLEQLRATGFIPREIQFVVLNDQADFIRKSVASVRNAALGGAGLAMLIVLLFLGSLRKTFVIGLGIPIAMLATFVMMGLGDLTLNIMSLGGLALGVGLLIDNSIVMLENIFRHREEGNESPEEAAHEGAAEVTSAVVASTTTNLAAVVPFLLISGLAALIFRELILTISFAIVASLGVALTLVPMLSAQLAKIRFTSGIGDRGPFVAFDHAVEMLRRGYRRVARPMVRWRWAVLGTGVVALGAAFYATRGVGNEFLPQVDDGNVSVNIMLPPGSSLEQTNAVTEEVESMTREMPHVRHIFMTAGGQQFGAFTAEQGGRGSLTVVLAPASGRGMSANAWVQQLQAKIDERGFPGARIFVSPPRIRGLRTSRAGDDVAITILGDDLAELQRIGEEIMNRIRDVPGVQGVRPSTDEASPLIRIELDRERASYLGLDVAAVGNTLRTAMDGTIATRYTEGNREYDVRVMFPKARFRSPEDIGSIALFPGGGGSAPIYLRDVASVASTLGPTSIRRENQNRILRITSDVVDDGTSVGEVNAGIRERLAGLTLPEGYGLLYGGEEEAIRENNRQLAIVVGLAIFLVFVVLSVQYESFVNPFVIILTIPLSMIGVGMALAITSTAMSAPVLLGVILLAGIVVNNAILLVDFIEHKRRDEGMSREDAVVEAGAIRLRPILMTTTTTACGMLPLALGIGSGTELMQPLAIAVVGGLTFSTFLTLFIVPSAYLIFNSGAEKLRHWLIGSGRAPVAARRAEVTAGD